MVYLVSGTQNCLLVFEFPVSLPHPELDILLFTSSGTSFLCLVPGLVIHPKWFLIEQAAVLAQHTWGIGPQNQWPIPTSECKWPVPCTQGQETHVIHQRKRIKHFKQKSHFKKMFHGKLKTIKKCQSQMSEGCTLLGKEFVNTFS